MTKKIIGVDLGGTSVKIAILDVLGNIEDQWSIPTDISDNGKNIVSDIIRSIQEYLLENSLSLGDIKGIGMGSPGKIDFEKGTVTGAYNLGWSKEQNIREQFEEAFGRPFYIDNDANVAALGEPWKGTGDNAPDVIFVTLGTGVGGGIIAQGQLLHGVNGSAGEIGHMVVDEDGFSCTCGNIGCLETVASATGIVNIAKSFASQFDETSELRRLILEHQVTAKDVFDYAKKNDSLGQKIVWQFANYLGKSLSQLANALNPNYIVIGGGVSAAGEFLLDKVKEEFDKFAFPTVRNSTKLALATLGNDAGVIGAASLVL